MIAVSLASHACVFRKWSLVTKLGSGLFCSVPAAPSVRNLCVEIRQSFSAINFELACDIPDSYNLFYL